MAEPRARAARHKGQLNFEKELTLMLHAYGDSSEPLHETIRVLDEIVTDFIIETCHRAAQAAAISKRQKVKLEDFRWVVRNDERMVGRIRELLVLDREMKEARKGFDTQEGKVGLERSGRKRKAEDDGEGFKFAGVEF
ncbi:MAG: hypothetical protein LQ342_001768 [Letrouitia transgressa]|nr:MAG: hypothetical protein LQ342_001768 [Letrouitia transgressa]